MSENRSRYSDTARSACSSPPRIFAKLARSGGPIHQVSSSSVGIAGWSSFCSAYWIERVMPGFGSVSVPSRSKKIADRVMSVRIARSQIARDLRSFLDIAADRDRGCRRAGAVGLLKTVIAAVKAGDHAGAAFAGG